MPHSITKTFSMCYGHRVWNQELDKDLSNNMPCKCRHLHGHEAEIAIELSKWLDIDDRTDTLKNGMVTDFNNLAWFKTWVDSTIDHKFIIDADDPMLSILIKDLSSASITGKAVYEGTHQHYVVTEAKTPEQKELLESFVIVQFVPTSENLAKWIFDIVQKRMKGVARVDSVTWHETPKSESTYRR